MSEEKVSNHDHPSIETNSIDAATYKDLVPYSSNMGVTKVFLRTTMEMILRYISELNDHHSPVIKNGLRTPEEYRQMFRFDIDDQGVSLAEMLTDCERVLQTSVRAGHPRFINQLSQGVDMMSLVGEMITSAINANMFTYEVAPVFNLMEETVLALMRHYCGWTNGDGILAPGGALSNLYAVLVARHRAFPDIKQAGYPSNTKLGMVISKHCHYSIKRAAAIVGLGTDYVFEVETDDDGRVLVQEVDAKIQECQRTGISIFFVGITAGTTVLGAFDPIDEVADICQKYGIWLHVDGAWGGSALLAPTLKHLLRGIEKADSFTWNPHKLMSIHLQCSAFLLKHPNILMDVNQMSAEYLFQQDKHYELTLDTGDKTIQCGRHIDILKLWLAWKGRGHQGYAEHVEVLFERAQFLYETIRARQPYFRLIMKPPFINVCFWYVPPSLQKMDPNSLGYNALLDKVAPQIKERMMNHGTMMVGYQRLDQYPNFFRAIISNPATTKEDILSMIDEIHQLGQDL